MYHQLSRATGRLVASTHLQSPLFPVAPIALQRVEPPTILYNTTHMSTVADACPAPGKTRLIPGTNTPYAPVSDKIRQLQKQFQKEDDVPVFLKGGPLDGILYRLTMALCIVGLVGVGHTIYTHAVPKK
ncbi:cytochrome c oxidase subunit 7A-related protein, mitochondrial-like [Helicoverpa zea]|uniref:cytochrome c oxidase subunit 7A-related protein, mitochondrial-like n=1 Tax=Helicoverpa zea TaxID=7113 RepID=UPI001F5809C5|nr:cytochrome c oxidase subunit 7A-related protein, mitochondrial-like [Helicoverpa zea]